LDLQTTLLRQRLREGLEKHPEALQTTGNESTKKQLAEEQNNCDRLLANEDIDLCLDSTMTVIRFGNNELMIHSPIEIKEELQV
jgi:hypothetical protein